MPLAFSNLISSSQIASTLFIYYHLSQSIVYPHHLIELVSWVKPNLARCERKETGRMRFCLFGHIYIMHGKENGIWNSLVWMSSL